MIVYTVETLDKYIGQKIKDPYNRTVGTLASIYSDVDGTVTAVEVLFGDIEFKTVEVGRLTIRNGELILLPKWKYIAMKVIDRLERARRRAKALEDLYAKGEIPKHAYEEFKNKVLRDLEKLKIEAKEAKDIIRKRMHELEDQIVQIEKALTALKMSYIAGEISERGYKPAADTLRQSRDRDLEEKNEAKKILETIQKLETADMEVSLVEPPAKQAEAETPIFVEVLQESAESEA